MLLWLLPNPILTLNRDVCFLALSGHTDPSARCLLSGVDRTWGSSGSASYFENNLQTDPLKPCRVRTGVSCWPSKISHQRTRLSCQRRYGVFFEVRADLAWVARSMSGGGCCSPAIACQTPT
jgi:hypothetical protein